MRRSLIASAAILFALAGPVQGQYSESLGDYDGTSASTGFPLPPVYIGTFSPGVSLAAASIFGTYGTQVVSSSTAGFDLFLDGILVAQCAYLDPGCWVSGADFRPWSYTFSGAELSIFDDGSADLTVVQTSATNLRIGGITLEGRVGTAVVPEPSTFLLLATGLLVLGWVGYRRRERIA